MRRMLMIIGLLVLAPVAARAQTEAQDLAMFDAAAAFAAARSCPMLEINSAAVAEIYKRADMRPEDARPGGRFHAQMAENVVSLTAPGPNEDTRRFCVRSLESYGPAGSRTPGLLAVKHWD